MVFAFERHGALCRRAFGRLVLKEPEADVAVPGVGVSLEREVEDLFTARSRVGRRVGVHDVVLAEDVVGGTTFPPGRDRQRVLAAGRIRRRVRRHEFAVFRLEVNFEPGGGEAFGQRRDGFPRRVEQAFPVVRPGFERRFALGSDIAVELELEVVDG